MSRVTVRVTATQPTATPRPPEGSVTMFQWVNLLQRRLFQELTFYLRQKRHRSNGGREAHWGALGT